MLRPMGDYYSQNIRSTILLWVYIKTCSCFGSSRAGIASRLILVPDFNIVSKKCKTMEWIWSLAENDLAIRNMRTISHPQSADPEKNHTADNWNLHKYKMSSTHDWTIWNKPFVFWCAKKSYEYYFDCVTNSWM